MRYFLAGALVFALAACGGPGSDELIPPEPYEIGHYQIPAGVSRGGQTLNGASQVSLTFATKMTTEELLAFFAEKNMRLSKEEDDVYELYKGKLANDADLQLQYTKEPSGPVGVTLYTLTVGSAVADIPVTSGEST
jgi:hypothetical protein